MAGLRPGVALFVVWACILAISGSLFASLPEIGWPGEGRVVGVDPSGGSITVEHGPIGQLLAAGRTSFPVRMSELLQHVGVGDEVAFVLTTPAESHGVLTVSSIRALPRKVPGVTPASGVVPRDVVMALVVLLLGIAVGFLWVESRRLRRLVEGREAVAKGLREQAQLQRQLNSSVEAAAAGLLPAVRAYQSQMRQVGEGIQVVLGEVRRSEPGLPHETARPTVIVRRGETETFRSLDERLGKPGLARVVWDRRRQERRSTAGPSGTERRRRERRGPIPVTWQGLGYVVVPPKARHLNVVG